MGEILKEDRILVMMYCDDLYWSKGYGVKDESSNWSSAIMNVVQLLNVW